MRVFFCNNKNRYLNLSPYKSKYTQIKFLSFFFVWIGVNVILNIKLKYFTNT